MNIVTVYLLLYVVNGVPVNMGINFANMADCVATAKELDRRRNEGIPVCQKAQVYIK